VKERRAKVTFSPADRSEVDRWQSSVKVAETPVGKYAAVLRKAREKRRALLERPERDESLQRVPTLYCSSPHLYSFGLSVAYHRIRYRTLEKYIPIISGASICRI